jgi:hypothetical protein
MLAQKAMASEAGVTIFTAIKACAISSQRVCGIRRDLRHHEQAWTE